MNWLLILVVAVVAGLAYRGYKKGLIQMVLSVVVIILSVVVTGIFAPVISKSLCESKVVLNYVSDGVNEGLGIEKNLKKMTQQAAGSIRGKKNNNTKKLNEKERKSVIANLDLPDLLTDSIMDSTADMIESTGQVTANRFSNYICDSLAIIIIRTLTYVATFLVARIILHILFTLFKVVDRIPGVEAFNELAGCAVGVVTGLLVVWIGFMLLVAFSSTSFGQECYRCINESPVLAFLYNNNLLLKWILSSLS